MIKLPRWFSWGLADQAMSSATNFGLTLIAGRVLGPEGLGVVFLGFAMYLLALALHRGLVFDPLVVTTASLDGEALKEKTSGGLSITLMGGSFAAAIMVVVGLVADGPLPRGMLLFAPWVLPAMLQDLWRALLFRDDRGDAAALNDLVWVIAMIAALPFAIILDSDWAVVACWGVGTVCAAIFGFFQIRVSFGRLGQAWSWWLSEAWSLGRWLAAGSLIYIASLQLVVFLLASVLGPEAIGGFRAVQTLFAPMTLLGPAAALPGLPRLARLMSESVPRARRLAAKLSGAVVSLATLYIAAVFLGGDQLLGFVFGQAFTGYEELIVPMSAGQLLLATGLGFSLLLKAAKRGDSLLITRVTAAVSAVALVPFMGSRWGLIGAAWGFVISSTLENAAVVGLSLSNRFGLSRGEAPDPAARLAEASD